MKHRLRRAAIASALVGAVSAVGLTVATRHAMLPLPDSLAFADTRRPSLVDRDGRSISVSFVPCWRTFTGRSFPISEVTLVSFTHAQRMTLHDSFPVLKIEMTDPHDEENAARESPCENQNPSLEDVSREYPHPQRECASNRRRDGALQQYVSQLLTL